MRWLTVLFASILLLYFLLNLSVLPKATEEAPEPISPARVVKVTENSSCSRTPELYVPKDFRCTDPKKVDHFGRPPWTRNLVNNPYEPACWEKSNSCAPFRCFPACAEA